MRSPRAPHSSVTPEKALRFVRVLRWYLLSLIGLALCLLLARVARYPRFFSMPGAGVYLAEAIGALALYAMVAWLLPPLATRFPASEAAARVGALFGVVGAAIEIASTALESLWQIPQSIITVTTLGAMLSLFALFAASGFVGGRRTHAFALGVGAALCSALVAMPLVVAFGFLLIYTSLPQLARNEVGDPDYARSGWTDVRAFAIANTYDAGFTHLVEGPVIAAILGAVGSALGQLRPRRS